MPIDEKLIDLLVDRLDSSPSATDLAYSTKDPAGTPLDKVVYWGTFFQRAFDTIVGKFQLATTTELTVATGAITVAKSRHLVDTEADAASDDLVTINGGAESAFLMISPASGARTIVIKHGLGNILCVGNADISLDEIHSFAILVYDATQAMWFASFGGSAAPMAGNGWQAVSQTWTYVSAITFTVPGDQTAIFTKGTKLKLTQTTDKYFYVTNSSYSAPDTTVTVTAGDDYSLANAAITSPYYSYAANPSGFPALFNYTPTFDGFSSAPTGPCTFFVIGRTCFVQIGTNVAGTSNATNFTISLPIPAANVGNTLLCKLALSFDNSAVSTTVNDYAQFAGDSATIVTLRKNNSATGWTASGTKNGTFQFFYPI